MHTSWPQPSGLGQHVCEHLVVDDVKHGRDHGPALGSPGSIAHPGGSKGVAGQLAADVGIALLSGTGCKVVGCQLCQSTPQRVACIATSARLASCGAAGSEL